MKIVVQCLYTQGWLDIAKAVIPNITTYCQKHGYSWNIKCIPEPYDAFEKIREIQRLFEAGEADVVMSMDCDAIFTNHLIKIEDLLDDEHYVYLNNDFNGLNTGVFIIKSSTWTYGFLGMVLLKKKYYPEITHCEQDAIKLLMEAEYISFDKVKFLPQQSINSYLYQLYPEIPPQTHEQGQWQMGNFVLHLPGVSMEQRLKILSSTPIVQ